MIPDSTIKIFPDSGIPRRFSYLGRNLDFLHYYIIGISFVVEFVYEVCSTKYSAAYDKIIIRNTRLEIRRPDY